MKYAETKVTFKEVPDLITLCINISNCPNKCPNCHSPHLSEDVGILLDFESLDLLIKGNKGIDCVAFMGGDSDIHKVNSLAEYIKKFYNNIKVAWYSGKKEISKDIDLWNFDYVKVGPYIEELGPLNKRTTNQRMYHIVHTSMGVSKLYDITSRFWKEDD